MRVAFWKNRGLCLFAGVWLRYSVCPPFLSYDSYWSVATAFVHTHGATSIAANQWSALPLNVDVARWRVWQWSDAQFLRGLK